MRSDEGCGGGSTAVRLRPLWLPATTSAMSNVVRPLVEPPSFDWHCADFWQATCRTFLMLSPQ